MTTVRLTGSRAAAKTRLMTGVWRKVGRKAMLMAGTVTAFGALEGCISVNAPDKPIVIELNINIKQEVIYRLAADAANTIEQNPDIF